MKNLILLLCAFGLVGKSGGNYLLAETVTPSISGDYWGIQLQNIPIPEDLLKKELKTGLTTTLIIETVLTDQNQALQRQRAVVNTFFELWEERYQLEIATAYGKKEQTHREIMSLLTSLRNLNILKIGKRAGAQGPGPYQVQVKYLLNPIDKSKSEKIRKWISENRASGFGASQTAGAANSPGIRFTQLFDSILDQYFSENGRSAKWEFTVESVPFVWKGVKHAD